MDKVIYRSLVKEDYEAVKELIGEAFGFNEFIKDKKFFIRNSFFYFYSRQRQ